ncbi:protein BREAST CANCER SUSCEPTIBILITY 2 homolog A-like [Aristolochia californica]|uniref:protein BREAST CANCER SUSCEPTIBILITY 2 homolog A-like n=1 Tax=Aristolochia californica TaxID=171875 RepID=UPI0035D674AE
MVETSQEFSNWQILADTGGHFRWEANWPDSDLTVLRTNEVLALAPNRSSAPLPSMYDLLVQGSPGQGCNEAPAFRTGSGKPITVKESSIQKAMAVFGEQDVTESGSLKLLQSSNGNSPLFQTGSGKPVSVKCSSIQKAFSVLGEEFNDTGSCKLLKHNFGDAPMFRTGSGKSIPVKPSAIQKALSVLEEGEIKDTGHGSNLYSFETGGGQKVDVSPASLIKAKTLLRLEEDFKSYALPEGTLTELHVAELCNWDKTQDLERRTGPLCGAEGIQNSRNEAAQCDGKDTYLSTKHLREAGLTNFLQPEVYGSGSKEPPVMFQTAGGRSVSVSSDAVKRAKILLGNIDCDILPVKIGFSDEERTSDVISSNKERASYASSLHQISVTDKISMNHSLPNKWPVPNQRQFSSLSGPINCGNATLKQTVVRGFVSETISVQNNGISSLEMPSRGNRPRCGPLVDISNDMGTTCTNLNTFAHEKHKLRRRNSVSPFKRPRQSRFLAPLRNDFSSLPSGSSTVSTSGATCCTTRVFTRYPFQFNRRSLKEFFGGPPVCLNLSGKLSDKVKCVNVDNAANYKFSMVQGSVGVEYFRHMLAQSGASLQIVTKGWLTNHFKWIIWKLASLEQGYPCKASGKFLTVSNVLEELKYRYEREVNHGHKSALKRILEGDTSPGCMVVLCISAIHSFPDKVCEKVDGLFSPHGEKLDVSHGSENSHPAKIELTDGWYSVNADLDAPLSKKLLDGKLFVGQKLRISGARLCGWVAPISALEVSSMVSLLLHINGTYRAHWAEQLGFCKGFVTPLAFRCIKPAGGPVPRTLVGVTRLYPILYKERLADGASVFRSEKMEFHMLQQYNRRRLIVADGVISERQKDDEFHTIDDYNDSEEGAKIFRLLETAMDPEILMADMNLQQLNSIATYRAKQEEIRQSRLQKKIEEALVDAGLGERQVTPFMRVRIVGLTGKYSRSKGPLREGMITIWNPTEKLIVDLIEGQIYSVEGLVPLNSEANVLYLHARGSSTKWRRLSTSASENFEPFFAPRKSTSILNLGHVPLASEFDIAAVVVYAGEVYGSSQQKKQWVFLTDGSSTGSDAAHSRGFSYSLLAVSFCLPAMDNELLVPVSYHLVGSTVGFRNLIKRAKDPVNHIWVAEATDNSTHYVCDSLSGCPDLKEAAQTVKEWAKVSSLAIESLKERILRMICVHEI